MTMVTEYDWESDTWTHTGDTAARHAWREAVAAIAAKAKTTLPDCAGRVDRAVQIVLNHDVALLEDGKAKVASQSNGQVVYHVVNGECSCKDYPKAPSGWCKHRIAAGLYKRATALVQRQLNGATNSQAEPPSQPTAAQPAVPTTPLPEAPASVNVHLELAGRQVQLTLRDSDEGRVLARLEAVLQRFPLVVPPTSTQGAAGQDRSERPGWCAKHGVQMTQNHKEGRSWWSHRLGDGSWCKGK